MSSHKPLNSIGVTRRDLIKLPVAAAAASLAVPWLGSLAAEAKGDAKCGGLRVAPRYYPRKHFTPQIDLRGKLAVVTGASRGIGRAIGEALKAQGADVIGTSRDPYGVADPPDFPLLPLDIANPASLVDFPNQLAANLVFQYHQGRVAILANNAARFVAGQIVPLPPTDFSFYLAQRDVGLRTLYSGHVMLTNIILPLMPQQGYSRIIFTLSVEAYLTFSLLPVGSLGDVYPSGKAALRCYANNLDQALRLGGSSIRVSTVNPYAVNTKLLEHPNPIYTQPVNSSGLSDNDPAFNDAITWLRGLLANGLPVSMAGEAYVQLLTMADPEQNVVVASPHGPLATRGGNALIEPHFLGENMASAFPLTCS